MAEFSTNLNAEEIISANRLIINNASKVPEPVPTNTGSLVMSVPPRLTPGQIGVAVEAVEDVSAGGGGVGVVGHQPQLLSWIELPLLPKRKLLIYAGELTSSVAAYQSKFQFDQQQVQYHKGQVQFHQGQVEFYKQQAQFYQQQARYWQERVSNGPTTTNSHVQVPVAQTLCTGIGNPNMFNQYRSRAPNPPAPAAPVVVTANTVAGQWQLPQPLQSSYQMTPSWNPI